MKSPPDWLKERQIGKPGSPKRLYWEFRNSIGLNSGGLYGVLDIMKQLSKALQRNDLRFFDKLAKGAHEFVKNDRETQSEGLCYFLPKAHEFLSSQKAIPLNKQQRRKLAAEMYIFTFKFEKEPDLPMPEFPENLQTEIDSSVEGILHTEHWSRLEQRAGVPVVPPAPSGAPQGRRKRKKQH